MILICECKDHSLVDEVFAKSFWFHLRGCVVTGLISLYRVPSEPRTLHAISAVHNSFCDQVRAAQLPDPNCIALCQKLDSVPLSDPIRKTYQISDDRLLETMRHSKPRVVVPTAAIHLRHQLLQEAHDTSYGAHLGTDKTF